MDLVSDLIVHGDDKGLHARFSDANASMYCEVYEKQVKIVEQGNIRIPSLKRVLDSLDRIESDIVRVKSDEVAFIITDGTKVGNSTIKLLQADKEYINSYQRIDGKLDIFDCEKLTYVNGKYVFENGFEMDVGILSTILKDAKAFDIERYQFFEKDEILTCNIENVAIGDSFKRKLVTISKLGKTQIPLIILGLGFRDIVNSLSSDKEVKKVKLYFTDAVVLITDGMTFYYNIHTLENN
jgi:hypothetical protein